MGVCYTANCNDCRQFIDLSKLRTITKLVYRDTPLTTEEDIEACAREAFWLQRWTWFLLKHMGHKVELKSDCEDDYYNYSFEEVAKP